MSVETSLAKLNDVRILWEVARAIGALPPEDAELTFDEYLQRHRVPATAKRRQWTDELWWLLDEIERQGIRRTVALPDDPMTATLTYRGTVADVLVKDGAYFIESAASADVWRAPSCGVCGKELAHAETGRPKRFCSATCRKRASRART